MHNLRLIRYKMKVELKIVRLVCSGTLLLQAVTMKLKKRLRPKCLSNAGDSHRRQTACWTADSGRNVRAVAKNLSQVF